MIDLQELERRLDETLLKETSLSLNTWFSKQRSNKVMKKVIFKFSVDGFRFTGFSGKSTAKGC